MGEGPGEEGDVNYPLHSMDVSKHMLCVCEVQRRIFPKNNTSPVGLSVSCLGQKWGWRFFWELL